MKFILLSAAIGSLTLLAANWVNATFSLWNRSVSVDFTQALLDRHGVYSLQLAVPVDCTRILQSKIRLLDADQDKFSYTPRANSLYTLGRGLFTIEKKRSLLITPPISAAVLPGKKGVLTFPVLLPPWTIDLLIFLPCACSVALFCCFPFPTLRPKALAQRSVALTFRFLRLLGTHPLIVLGLPSAYLLAVYPPLWKDVDALSQLILPADVGNIYHFPALFCFSARAIIWLGDSFSIFRPPELLALQRPTVPGIYCLVVVQHLALVLSLGLLCNALTKRKALRGAFVLAFCSVSSLYTNALLCGSEAWSVCATISLFAFGVRLYSAQGNDTINWIGYGFSLVLAIGSRSINLLLGFWLVGLCLIASMTRPGFGQQDQVPLRPLSKACLAFLFLCTAVLSNSLLELYLAREVGVEPRTTVGRTLSDRIDSFLAHIHPAERARLAQELSLRASDHAVGLAVRDQATIGSFYNGTNAALEQQLKEAGFSGERLEAEKDRAIFKATLIYYKTFHPALIRVIWRDFLAGFTTTTSVSMAREPFAENSYVGTYRLERPDQWNPLNALSSTFLPESVAWLDRSATDVYLKPAGIKGLGHANLGSVLFVTLLLLGFCFWRRRGMRSRAIPAVTILLTGVGIFAATMVCVYFMPRYTLPLCISIYTALCLSIDGLLQNERGQRRGAHHKSSSKNGV